MEKIEYRTVDKTGWGEGPWQSEPDKRQWQDEATGLPCLIVRGPAIAVLRRSPGTTLYMALAGQGRSASTELRERRQLLAEQLQPERGGRPPPFARAGSGDLNGDVSLD